MVLFVCKLLYRASFLICNGKLQYAVGAIAGFDLAHARQCKIELHNLDADTLVQLHEQWALKPGIYINQKHIADSETLFCGWWGHTKDTH